VLGPGGSQPAQRMHAPAQGARSSSVQPQGAQQPGLAQEQLPTHSSTHRSPVQTDRQTDSIPVTAATRAKGGGLAPGRSQAGLR